MDETTTNALRWVLMTDELSWKGEMDRALQRVATTPGAIEEMAVFLEEKFEDADAMYQARMRLMIDITRLASSSHRGPSDVVPGLAQEFVRLDGEVAELEAQLKAARATREEIQRRLLAGIEPGGARETLGFRFEHMSAGEQIRVVDPQLLPVELTSVAPNHEAIGHWHRLQGTAPRGTEVVAKGAWLQVVQLA